MLLRSSKVVFRQSLCVRACVLCRQVPLLLNALRPICRLRRFEQAAPLVRECDYVLDRVTTARRNARTGDGFGEGRRRCFGVLAEGG